jgi:release factor glutamine methyltransferase
VTFLEVIQRSAEFLDRKGVESPRLQVELLLAHVTGLPRLQLYLNYDRLLTEIQLNCLRELVVRRGSREPLQHLLGTVSFCGLEFAVNPDVLIPRPETEVLAELAWSSAGSMSREGGPLRILDFGTGSGCLAVTLAVKCPTAKVYAVDISQPALAIAAANSARHGVSERVHFFCGDGLESIGLQAHLDLMVANPPYIPTAEIITLDPEVRDHDPRVALDGGPDGLAVIRSIAAGASRRLRPGGILMVEIGDRQELEARRVFEDSRWLVEGVREDLSGRPRILIARSSGA